MFSYLNQNAVSAVLNEVKLDKFNCSVPRTQRTKFKQAIRVQSRPNLITNRRKQNKILDEDISSMGAFPLFANTVDNSN